MSLTESTVSSVRNIVPASLRGQRVNARFPAAFAPSSAKPYLVTGLEARTAPRGAALKARFLRLPQEPEDARLTGVTRSLNRRLLGLNLAGSLLGPRQITAAWAG